MSSVPSSKMCLTLWNPMCHCWYSLSSDREQLSANQIVFNFDWLFFLFIQSLVEQCPTDDPDTEVNMGCLLFKVIIIIIIFLFSLYLSLGLSVTIYFIIVYKMPLTFKTFFLRMDGTLRPVRSSLKQCRSWVIKQVTKNLLSFWFLVSWIVNKG